MRQEDNSSVQYFIVARSRSPRYLFYKGPRSYSLGKHMIYIPKQNAHKFNQLFHDHISLHLEQTLNRSLGHHHTLIPSLAQMSIMHPNM